MNDQKMMEVINFIQRKDAANLTQLLQAENYVIYDLDTTGVDDVKIFYKQLISVLPVGIPLSGNVHWDAFLDSVWEGITEAPVRKAAFIWNGANSIIAKSLSDFTTIISVLTQLTQTLNENEPRCEFVTIIIGDTPNFK